MGFGGTSQLAPEDKPFILKITRASCKTKMCKNEKGLVIHPTSQPNSGETGKTEFLARSRWNVT